MPDELWISGNGSSAVATDDLYWASQQLARLATEVTALECELALVDELVSPGEANLNDIVLADDDIDQARMVLAEIQSQSRILGFGLTSAADGYGFTEAFVQHLAGGVLGTVAGTLGFAVPHLVPALAGIGGVAALAGVDGADVSTMLSRAAAVEAVRAGSMVVDDVMLSAAGIPAPLVGALGDGGLDVTGVAFGASGVVLAGSAVGLLRETPVALAATTPRPISTAPSGFAERFERIPKAAQQDGAQVVIEKYEAPGEPDRFEVYVGGTVTFDPVATDEPWDMTSNMSNAMGGGSGSYRSVAEAMRLAGIDASSPVQFTGYSQGGGTVAQLAASGDYNTQGVLTFGGPTGQIHLPEGVPTVIVEHRDDIVPALGGTQENRSAVIVERDVFGGESIPQDKPIPAHHREYYLETARLMDAAHSDQVTCAIAKLDSFAAGASTVTSTAYRFERVSGGPSSGGAG